MNQHQSTHLGQPALIKNKPAIVGILRTQAVRRVDRQLHVDRGHDHTHAANPFFTNNLRYDSVTDFEPLNLIGMVSNAPVVPIKSRFNSVAQLTAELRATRYSRVEQPAPEPKLRSVFPAGCPASGNAMLQHLTTLMRLSRIEARQSMCPQGQQPVARELGSHPDRHAVRQHDYDPCLWPGWSGQSHGSEQLGAVRSAYRPADVDGIRRPGV